jgi:hypothetical protein
VTGGPTDYSVSTRPYGAYPVLRAAMENAGLAIWLMKPEERADRVARYLSWWLQEAWYHDKAIGLMGQDPSGRPDVRAWVAEVAGKNGIPTSAYADRLKFYKLVREAARSFSGGGCRADSRSTLHRCWSSVTLWSYGERCNPPRGARSPPRTFPLLGHR